MRTTPTFGLERQCKILPIFKSLNEVVLKWQTVDMRQASVTGVLN